MSGELTRKDRDTFGILLAGACCEAAVRDIAGPLLRRYESALTECEASLESEIDARSYMECRMVDAITERDAALYRLATLEAEAKVGREAVKMLAEAYGYISAMDDHRNADDLLDRTAGILSQVMYPEQHSEAHP